MEFKHVQLGVKGAVRAIYDDVQYGEIIYTMIDDMTIRIDHTEVEPISKGKGVGKKLVKELVDIATEKNWKIIPICPFAKAEFDKNPEYSTVLFE